MSDNSSIKLIENEFKESNRISTRCAPDKNAEVMDDFNLEVLGAAIETQNLGSNVLFFKNVFLSLHAKMSALIRFSLNKNFVANFK